MMIVSIVLGVVGPLLLTPVVIWLDTHPHTLRAAMWWEPIFRWVWPASPILMTGGGVKPLSPAYFLHIIAVALWNIVFFCLAGAAVGGAIVLVRRWYARLRPPT